MLSLFAKIRKELGKKAKVLRKKGILPGVLYGPKIENLSLELNQKEFEKIYETAGESSLITLEVDPSTGSGQAKKFLVLIHTLELDVISQKPIHVDFYQPSLEKEVAVTLPLVFEGEALAVKDSGGTLVKNISELEVKALPQNLPHEIKVNIENLKTFADNIKILDLKLPEGVKVQRAAEEIVAHVLAPVKVEEELVKPIEEKVEEVEKVEEKKVEKEERVEKEKK
jgi:large subunit ribosomal protein L25